MIPDGDSQAVEFIEPDVVDCPGFAVGQDDGFADDLGTSQIEFGKNRACSYFCGWHDDYGSIG